MAEKKKSLFDKAVDALTNRDEKAELEQAKMAAEAASREAAALKAKMAADKAAAAKTAAQKVANTKAAAEAAAKREAFKKASDAKVEAAKPKKGIVVTRSLRVRKDHNTDASVVAGLDEGNEVSVLETWTDGKNVWAKIGEDQWAAMEYDGQTLMKFA